MVFFGLLFLRERHPSVRLLPGDLVKTLLTITSGIGIAALLFAGYVFLKTIPDVGRYVRISRM
jgi:hypothetical protein